MLGGPSGERTRQKGPLVSNGNSTRGRFARLVVFVNLDKPLTSKVFFNGDIQQVEYESLPTIYFSYVRYGHAKELCSLVGVGAVLERPKAVLESSKATVVMASGEIFNEGGDRKNTNFGPRILVKRKSRRGSQDSRANEAVKKGKDPLGSRFMLLIGGNDAGGGFAEADRGYGRGK
ncbi:hypothetical protein PVK06_008140 [Gossypium arboreum]|uniref:Uncharacterized protein n=1 Tax=Gossypium arboreum TaxID=29729 RepID=A0ABR0QJX5_GOSAR|nr:hypothetical protein PVK06_008140 [Gossypium arboreum]